VLHEPPLGAPFGTSIAYSSTNSSSTNHSWVFSFRKGREKENGQIVRTLITIVYFITFVSTFVSTISGVSYMQRFESQSVDAQGDTLFRQSVRGWLCVVLS
jgi:hypothetical protein